MFNVNIKSVILLLLLTTSANATTFICTCLCSATAGESEENCKDWCEMQMTLQGGSDKVCPVRRFEYTEFNKTSVWIIVGSVLGGNLPVRGPSYTALTTHAKLEQAPPPGFYAPPSQPPPNQQSLGTYRA